jgi:hypothetical protein
MLTDREYQLAWQYGREAGFDYGEAANAVRSRRYDRWEVEEEAHGVAFEEALADSALMDADAAELSAAIWDGVAVGLDAAEDLGR